MEKCQVCQHKLNSIPVAKSPIAGYKSKSLEESLSQKYFDMTFLFCDYCTLLHYKYFDAAEEILEKIYKEHPSTYYITEQLENYLNDFVENISKRYKISESSLVLEIGCNNGRLISLFKEISGCDTLGVEPSQKFKTSWRNYGIEVINDYFNEKVRNQLKNRKIHLIIVRHVFEHIQKPLFFLKNLVDIVGDDTIVIIEVPYLKTILEKKRIDNIGYSHLNYFSVRSMDEILKKSQMGIFDCFLEETDGGSIVFHIKKNFSTDMKLLDRIDIKDIYNFLNSIVEVKSWLKQRVKKYSRSEIVGYGAGAKGSHLIYILGLQEFMDVVVDDTPGYIDTYIPGTKIQIKSPRYLNNDFIKGVINLAPTHTETIRAKIPNRINFIDIFDQ